MYGYLPVEYAEVGTKVDVVYFGERLGATVAKEPLYDPGRQQDEGVNSKRNANRRWHRESADDPTATFRKSQILSC